MPRSQKPRRQRRHRIPSNLSRNGMEIVKPEHATERAARNYLSTGVLLIRACFNPEVRERVAPILRNDQSIGRKIERIRAEVWEKNIEEFHSSRHMNLLGMRMVECQCGPGVGHNAPPQRPRR